MLRNPKHQGIGWRAITFLMATIFFLCFNGFLGAGWFRFSDLWTQGNEPLVAERRKNAVTGLLRRKSHGMRRISLGYSHIQVKLLIRMVLIRTDYNWNNGILPNSFICN